MGGKRIMTTEPCEQTLLDCILYIQVGDEIYTVADLTKEEDEED